LTEHRAADEIAPQEDETLVAAGFNRLGPLRKNAGNQEVASSRNEVLTEMTNVVGSALLGVTLGCARCHDHKFDPIRQADFYRLQAFFTPARFRDDFPLALPADRKKHEKAVTAWEAELATVLAAILAIEKPIRDRLAPGLPMGALDEAVAAYHKPESERTPAEVKLVYSLLSHDPRIKVSDWPRLLGEEKTFQRSTLIAKLESIKK